MAAAAMGMCSHPITEGEDLGPEGLTQTSLGPDLMESAVAFVVSLSLLLRLLFESSEQ